MKTNPVIAVLLLFLLISCGDKPEGTQTVKGPTYSLEVPASMTKTTTLNTEASLQYMNGSKELYVIVIDETKAEMQAAIDIDPAYAVYSNDLQGYYSLLTENIKNALSIDSLPEPKDTKINGLNAKIVEVDGYMENQHIYWKFAFIEGKKQYYQIMAWTLADRKEKHEAAMQDMIASFRETSKSKY